MKPFLKQYMHKHNGFLALVLSLALVVSGSLQLVHDQLVDHQHDSECAMYAVEGNAPLATATSSCITTKQVVEVSSYSTVALTLSQFDQYSPRGPPATL